MNDADRALAAIAATQRHVVTRAQARACGISASGLYKRIRSGLLVPYGAHTIHFAGTTLDYLGQLQAGTLDLGDGALVSGRAAAALHGLDGFGDGPLDFLVPRSMRRRRTIGRVTSTPVIGPLDRTTVDGLPVTSGTLTILQLLGVVTPRELGNAIDSATRAGITAPIVLRRRLEELGRRGRAGVALFDKVMDSAGVESWLEREFLKLIRRAGLPLPTTQRIYRRDGRHIARVDFDFDPAPIVVEVGGRRGYLCYEDRHRQERRRNELQLLGKTVYFFTTEDVADERYVIETLRAGLGLAA